MWLRHFSSAATITVTLALATPAHAVTEIQWWHAMTGPNNDAVVKLANDFNASQSDYKIQLIFENFLLKKTACALRSSFDFAT